MALCLPLHGRKSITAQMVSSPENRQKAQRPEHGPARRMLDEFLRLRRPPRTLVVTSGKSEQSLIPATSAFPHFTLAAPPGPGDSSVRCSLAQLPFQSGAFDLLVAHHVLCDGREAFLGEFKRLLEGGGHLLVFGLGYWGSRYRISGGDGELAAVRPIRLCGALQALDFTIELCTGEGVAGVRMNTGTGWSRPLVGISDRVQIRARVHGNRRVVTPMRFSSPQTVGARSAALDGLNREAVS